MKVRATKECYLGDAGYKTPDDGIFEYNGPPHHCLEEVVEEKPKAPKEPAKDSK